MLTWSLIVAGSLVIAFFIHDLIGPVWFPTLVLVGIGYYFWGWLGVFGGLAIGCVLGCVFWKYTMEQMKYR